MTRRKPKEILGEIEKKEKDLQKSLAKIKNKI